MGASREDFKRILPPSVLTRMGVPKYPSPQFSQDLTCSRDMYCFFKSGTGSQAGVGLREVLGRRDYSEAKTGFRNSAVFLRLIPLEFLVQY